MQKTVHVGPGKVASLLHLYPASRPSSWGGVEQQTCCLPATRGISSQVVDAWLGMLTVVCGHRAKKHAQVRILKSKYDGKMSREEARLLTVGEMMNSGSPTVRIYCSPKGLARERGTCNPSQSCPPGVRRTSPSCSERAFATPDTHMVTAHGGMSDRIEYRGRRPSRDSRKRGRTDEISSTDGSARTYPPTMDW